jgi:Flp pilus assembly protein TadG
VVTNAKFFPARRCAGKAVAAANPPLRWLMIGKRKPPVRFDRPQAFDNESALVSATTSFLLLGYSMSLPAASIAHVRKTLRRFRRNRRGSAAVEFALVAPLFFALLFAIIETALVFFAGQVLETITQNSARQVLTGQAQGSNYAGWSNFRDGVVCAQIPALFTCANILVDVESFPSFANVVLPNHVDANGNFDASTFGYNPGGSCAIVVVQLYYAWPIFVTGLGYNIANMAGNKRQLVATAAFRNEPYNGPCPS